MSRKNQASALYNLKYPHYLPARALIWVVKPGDNLLIKNEPYTIQQVRHPVIPGELPSIICAPLTDSTNPTNLNKVLNKTDED